MQSVQRMKLFYTRCDVSRRMMEIIEFRFFILHDSYGSRLQMFIIQSRFLIFFFFCKQMSFYFNIFKKIEDCSFIEFTHGFFLFFVENFRVSTFYYHKNQWFFFVPVILSLKTY